MTFKSRQATFTCIYLISDNLVDFPEKNLGHVYLCKSFQISLFFPRKYNAVDTMLLFSWKLCSIFPIFLVNWKLLRSVSLIFLFRKRGPCLAHQLFNLSIIFYSRNNPNAALVLYSRKLFVGKHVFLRDDYRKMKNRVMN